MKTSDAGHMRFLVRKAQDTKEQAKNRKEKAEHKINPHTLMATTIHCMQDPKIILPLFLLISAAAPAAASSSCKTFDCSVSGPQKGVMVKPGQQNNVVIECETNTNTGFCSGDFHLDCQFSSGNGNNALGPNTNVFTFLSGSDGVTCLEGCGPTQQATTTIWAQSGESNDKHRSYSLTVENHGNQTLAARCATRSGYKRT